MIKELREYYVKERVKQVDQDYLQFEEEMIRKEDLKSIIQLREKGVLPCFNPHNSILLYITNCTDEFDFKKGRSDMTGGSPPDIDTDLNPSGRDELVKWIIEKWGRENVAHIGTYGCFGLDSIARDITRISEPVEPMKSHYEESGDYDEAVRQFTLKKKNLWENFKELSKQIPNAVHGIAPDYKKLLDSSPNIEEEFPEYSVIAKYADQMRKSLGIHAAGLVLCNEPIHDYIPVWKNDKSDRITQFDKVEVEELGLLKLDLLVVAVLDVIKETLRLIKETHKIDLDLQKDIYEKDGDEKTYKLLCEGYVVGVFQMETSATAKSLIQRIKPTCIDHLSDISALNRPGPLDAGYAELYIKNKDFGIAPEDMPKELQSIVKETFYVITYQEQIMRIVSELAGFTLREADDVRRAMGKKDKEKLEKIKDKFIKGAKKNTPSIGEEYLEHLWKDMLGFAEYAFNKSHSCAYSYVTYATAWLKANYPMEFYRAFLSIKAQELAPEDFQDKLKEVIVECKHFGIEIKPPDINKSKIGFIGSDNVIYFGFSGIKTIAVSSADAIIKARKDKPFEDIWDFLTRINRTKVNSGKFKALVKAGCFDRMGYCRAELLKYTDDLYSYFDKEIEYQIRLQEMKERDIQRAEAEAKGERKLPALKPKEQPEKINIERHSKIIITANELQEQADFIGCYLNVHPSETVKGNFIDISRLWIGEIHSIRGIVTYIKEIKDKKGNSMAFLKIEDKTGICEATVFSSEWKKYKDLKTNMLVKAKVKVEKEQPLKVIVNELHTLDGV